MKEPHTLTVKNYIGYGVTDIFGGGAFAVIGAWLMYFYVTYCGLSPIEAGSILFIARILDTFISPLVGYITDNIGNTRIGRRFGRRRSFLLMSCPLLLVYALMWVNNMNYFYYLATYLMMEVVAAMIIIPYEAIASEMTSDYKERTRLSAARIIASGVGTSLATFIPGQLFNWLGHDSTWVFFY
ncbi:MFS transporter [Pantoea tagorei]